MDCDGPDCDYDASFGQSGHYGGASIDMQPDEDSRSFSVFSPPIRPDLKRPRVTERDNLDSESVMIGASIGTSAIASLGAGFSAYRALESGGYNPYISIAGGVIAGGATGLAVLVPSLLIVAATHNR
jgi:hypothetical protein